ncbi:MAG: acyl-CoA carboxylase subunit beta [Dehalococcoidia bacterium]|nr:acyl-CoA carboxylase subunit beta [Dehalococcoidia bacterium]
MNANESPGGRPQREAELARLAERRAWADGLGGPDKVARQHARGRMTARERANALVDEGTFVELGALAHAEDPERAERSPGDGIITGYGRIDGRMVAIEANDATVLGGSNGMEAALRKGDRVRDFAEEKGYPLIYLAEGGGGRVGDMMGWVMAKTGGMRSIRGHSSDPRRRVPMAVAVLGQSYGSAALNTGIADFAVMTRTSSFSISSPALVEATTGGQVTEEELGGPDVHSRVTGLVDRVCESEIEALAAIRDFVGLVPLSAAKPLPIQEPDDPVDRRSEDLRLIVPEKSNRAFDMKRVVRAIVDGGRMVEFQEGYGRSLVTALARVGGVPVGLVGNNSMFKAGSIDVPAAQKMARFLSMCDTFGIPLVFLHDVPGVLIGKEPEHSGIIRHMMQVMTVLGNCRVPRIAVIVRKSYGLAFAAMSGSWGPNTFTFAWPSARIGFMAPEAGVRIAFGHELADPGADPGALAARHAGLIDQWDQSGAPWMAAGMAYIDDVIDPAETREKVFRALEIALGRSQ